MTSSQEIRREAIAELIARDGTYTMRQLRGFLEIDHGIAVTKETIRVDLRALGYAKRWVRLPDKYRTTPEAPDPRG